jgi:hypothetical protein
MLSLLTSTDMLMAAPEAAVNRYFYSSSACVDMAQNADERRCRAAARE